MVDWKGGVMLADRISRRGFLRRAGLACSGFLASCVLTRSALANQTICYGPLYGSPSPATGCISHAGVVVYNPGQTSCVPGFGSPNGVWYSLNTTCCVTFTPGPPNSCPPPNTYAQAFGYVCNSGYCWCLDIGT